MADGLSCCLCCLCRLSLPAAFAAPSAVPLAAAFALPSAGFVAVFPVVAAAHPAVFVVRLSVVAAAVVVARVAALRSAALAVADAVAPAARHLAAQPVGVRWSPAGFPQDGSHWDCLHSDLRSAGGWDSRGSDSQPWHLHWAGWRSVDLDSAGSRLAAGWDSQPVQHLHWAGWRSADSGSAGSHSAAGWDSRHLHWADWRSVDSGSADWHLTDDSDSRWADGSDSQRSLHWNLAG